MKGKTPPPAMVALIEEKPWVSTLTREIEAKARTGRACRALRLLEWQAGDVEA